MDTHPGGADRLELFRQRGFLGPVPVLDKRQCHDAVAALKNSPRPAADWLKGFAVTSRAYYELARHPGILDLVCELIGQDVMLWGASLATRVPGQRHRWHTDVETHHASDRTVSVWIGLDGTQRHSALRLVPYSHRFGVTIQELSSGSDGGKSAADSDVLAWARQYDRRSSLAEFDIGDGDALVFDGRLWHGSINATRRQRTAVLLQYATPDTPIRVFDFAADAWPMRVLEQPKPPCIMVRGTDTYGVNKMVTGPPAEGSRYPTLSSWVSELKPPVTEESNQGWKYYPVCRVSTSSVRQLKSHVSVLGAEQIPHPPHEHVEEELLVMLSGELEVLLYDGDELRSSDRLRRGAFAYYSAHQRHTIRCVGPEPATYVVLKWRAHRSRTECPLESSTYHPAVPEDGDGTVKRTRVFNSPTHYLGRLKCHATYLEPGGGYAPHSDAYDVAIVTLAGTVETLDQRVGPDSVIFYAAGQPHGMRNVGQSTATYLVFEFHGAPAGLFSWGRRAIESKLKGPMRWFRRRSRRDAA